VLRRDRFRCVTCGRSPATDLGCVLHVDHVVAFSREGKTREDNLRTLCDDCNLGKSDGDA
jgi:5-methylcytosine-specific restriction endonuclease McrA